MVDTGIFSIVELLGYVRIFFGSNNQFPPHLEFDYDFVGLVVVRGLSNVNFGGRLLENYFVSLFFDGDGADKYYV